MEKRTKTKAVTTRMDQAEGPAASYQQATQSLRESKKRQISQMTGYVPSKSVHKTTKMPYNPGKASKK